MALFTTETYNRFKDILHPNVRHNIEHYRSKRLIHLPPYHGCHKKYNRNGTRHLIEYSHDEQCIMPTDKRYWKKYVKDKYRIRKVYFTRYMTMYGLSSLAKCKGDSYYNYKKEQYINRKDW